VRASVDRTQELGRLRLLASAIAGRPVEVAAADAGEPAWTDGTTVFVDADAGPADRVRMLGVQASLLAAGSLDAAVLRRIARRPDRARRYLAVEGHRALAVNEDALPPVLRSLVDPDVASGLDSPEASLQVARSRQTVADPPRVFGTIEPRRIATPVPRSAPGTAEGRSATASPERPPALEPDEDDDPDLGHLLSSPVGGGGAIGRLLQRLLRPARARADGGAPGAATPTHVPRPGAGSWTTGSSRVPDAPEHLSLFVRPTARYPEWDVHRGAYRAEWCTVHESDPPLGTGSLPATSAVIALRRALARLGVGLTRCRRRAQGDDIDLDAAVEARVDRIAGSPHEGDTYIEHVRRRRDLAVLVLLDVSGSAAEPATGGKSVHDHQRMTAAALTVALDELGDRVALHAFNSRGRKAVQLWRVKEFDDRLDGRVARRLHGLEPAAYTRLGAAIRHGTTVLEQRGGTPRRLLVVLSDGFAYDHGYEGRRGEADARRALAEARRRGVGCLCLSVGAVTDPEALRRVFGSAAHAAVPDAERLPGLIGPLFRAALRSAEARRRSFQRTERTRERLEIERRTDDRGAAVLRTGR
jgi:hypothetical protein